MAKVASVVLTVFVCAFMVKGRIFNTIDEGNAVHKEMVSGVATDFSAVGSIRMPASEKNIGTMDNLEDDVLRAPWRNGLVPASLGNELRLRSAIKTAGGTIAVLLHAIATFLLGTSSIPGILVALKIVNKHMPSKILHRDRDFVSLAPQPTSSSSKSLRICLRKICVQ